MAKKTQPNNKELVQVALNSHKWINTPVVYTSFGSNFNSFQQDVMLQVSGHLQDYMKQYLDDGRYLSKEPPPKPMFTKAELDSGLAPIRLELSEFGIRYDYDVKAALEAITQLWVRKPVFDEQTGIKKGEDVLPVFKKVFLPESAISQEGETYKYRGKDKTDKDGNTVKYVPMRNDGYIEVTINEDVAAYVFDMSRGYFNHLERIAYFCNSAHTSRLYLLLMSYVSRGQMSPQIPYFDLKEHLGMVERDKETNDVIGIKYEKFSQFSKQVLNVAQTDMQRLASDNKTEIIFEYEPVYRGFRKRGDPAFVKFSISRTELGKARDMRLHRRSKEDRIVMTLAKQYPTLDIRILSMVVSSVTDEQWDEFCKYTKAIQKIVNEVNPDDTAAFIISTLRKWINDRKQPEAEPSLFDDVDYAEVQSVKSDVDYSADVISNLQTEFGNGQMGYEYYFSRHATCTIVNGHEVTIAVPSSCVSVIVNSPHVIERIIRCVTKVIGDSIKFDVVALPK